MEQIKQDFPLLFWEYNDFFNRKKRLEQTKEVANDGSRKLFKGLEAQNPGKRYCDLLENVIEKHGMWGEFGMNVHDNESYNFKTFCHGDPWFNNIMYKFKDNQLTPKQAALIDFQVCKLFFIIDNGSFKNNETYVGLYLIDEKFFFPFQMSSYNAPALDLVYFLASSTVGEFRKNS